MASIFLMIVELAGTISSWDKGLGGQCTKAHFSLLRLRQRKNRKHRRRYSAGNDWHFPCIQSRELGPDYFHSKKVSPWINHVDVPSWCESRVWCCDFPKDWEGRANFKYLAVIYHLTGDVSIFRQRKQHQNITDVSICPYFSQFHVGFLMPSQVHQENP